MYIYMYIYIYIYIYKLLFALPAALHAAASHSTLTPTMLGHEMSLGATRLYDTSRVYVLPSLFPKSYILTTPRLIVVGGRS